MDLTDELLKEEKKPVFVSELGMVKRINKKLVLKYSPKEQPYGSPKGLRGLWNKSPHCFYCNRITTLPDGGNTPNRKDTATIDHKHPRGRGGKNDRENRVLSCHECNSDKAHLTEGEYRAVLAYRKSISKT